MVLGNGDRFTGMFVAGLAEGEGRLASRERGELGGLWVGGEMCL
jgi:hypothetical protein